MGSFLYFLCRYFLRLDIEITLARYFLLYTLSLFFMIFVSSLSIFRINILFLVFGCPCAEWFAFLGHQANLTEPGSPYAVSFRSDISDSSGMKPLNITVYSCGDHSLSCSCGDCPSSSVCMNNAPSASRGKRSCSFKMGSLKVTLWIYFF